MIDLVVYGFFMILGALMAYPIIKDAVETTTREEISLRSISIGVMVVYVMFCVAQIAGAREVSSGAFAALTTISVALATLLAALHVRFRGNITLSWPTDGRRGQVYYPVKLMLLVISVMIVALIATNNIQM